MENNQAFNSMPRIGDKAPDFSAITTTGPMQFSEYAKDSWVVMFSHPADFTPVCTTEMSAFAIDKDWFTARGVKLLGLSIDSIHAHLGWVNNVREKTGVFFNFPIIADLDMKVAKLYGMLHPSESATAAVRAVFFIDPKQEIRLIMYYPLSVGRNMEEIKRALVALQTADAKKVALPVNWKEGDKAIVLAPRTLEEMDERLASKEYEVIDFYLAKTSLN